MEWRKDDYLITDDNSKVQLDIVHRLLAATYWGGRRPRETVERMVAGSICFSLYRGVTQIGFGRAITDSATFTWVADIVVEPEFRGAGLGQWIMECLVSHPAITGTQMVLQTRDAQGLYEKFGFSGNSALMSTKATEFITRRISTRPAAAGRHCRGAAVLSVKGQGGANYELVFKRTGEWNGGPRANE